MKRYFFLLLPLVILYSLPSKSQNHERGIRLPLSQPNVTDLEFAYTGTTHLTLNYDHVFFLMPVRSGPGILLRAGLGDGLGPGYGLTVLTEAAYTTGYLTFVELGAGYNGRIYESHWQHIPYFLAAFRYRANGGFSLRLISRLLMHKSDAVPLFGAGLSIGFSF